MTSTDQQPESEPPDASTAPLDYYANAEAWKPSATTTLADLIDAIRSDEFAETVIEVRQLIAMGAKSTSDALKKKLPAVSLSGTVTGRRKNAVAESRFEHSGLLQIDLDAKDNPGWTVADMREALTADPRMVAAFVTPSGNGMKGVARVPADASQHKAAFLAAEAHFRTLNLKIDPSCKDPVRLCFVSHDQNAWMREEPTTAMFEPVALTLVDEFDGWPVDDDDDEDDNTDTDRPAHRSGPASFVSPTTGGLVLRANGHQPPDAATTAEMLAPIPRQPYGPWLKIASAVWDGHGEAEGTELLKAWAPEENEGEYAAKYQHRLKDVHFGSLVMMAKEHGYEPSKKAKQAIKETIKAKTVAAILAESAKRPESQQFAPADVFYDAPAGKYLVKSGKSYFTFNKAGPVSTGIMRYLAPKYQNPATLQTAVTSAIRNRELDGAVQWAGEHRRAPARAAIRSQRASDPDHIPSQPATASRRRLRNDHRNPVLGFRERDRIHNLHVLGIHPIPGRPVKRPHSRPHDGARRGGQQRKITAGVDRRTDTRRPHGQPIHGMVGRAAVE